MVRRKDHAPPANWQDFEDLCLKLWRPRLVDAKKNGRSGQPQAGVDIFGRDPKTETWVGIQCKQRGQWPKKVLTVAEIEAEVEQALGFEPPLSQFIVATTAPRDVEVQKFVREFSDRRRAEGKFSVDLFAWDDLQDWLQEATVAEEAILLRLADRLGELKLLPVGNRPMPPVPTNSLVPPRLLTGTEPSTGRRAKKPLSIEEAVATRTNLLIVGETGSGKSTALTYLAHSLVDKALAGGLQDESDRLIPLIIPLKGLRETLRDRVREELHSLGLPNRALLSCERCDLLLLLDGLDQASDHEALLSQLAELPDREPRWRWVITSRPMAGLDRMKRIARTDLLFLDQITLGEAKTILRLHLGAARGGEVADRLHASGISRALRSPLMTWLFAIAAEEDDPLEDLSSRLGLARAAFEKLFVEREALRSVSLADPPHQEYLGFLKALALSMVETNTYQLPRAGADELALDLHSAGGALVDESVSLGTLVRSRNDDLSFAHSFLRDFLAASELADRLSRRRLLRCFFLTRWHEVTALALGLAEPQVAKRYLRWMISASRIAARFVGIFYPARNVLAVTLASLANAKPVDDQQATDFLEIVRNEQFSIGWSPLLFQAGGGVTDHPIEVRMNGFCSWIGQLGTQEARDLLQDTSSYLGRRHRVFGLAQLEDATAIRAILRSFEEPEEPVDLLADWNAGSLLLSADLDLLVSECRAHFRGASKTMKKRILAEALHPNRFVGALESLKGHKGYTEWMAELYLESSDREVADAALTNLHMRSSLPKAAETIFLSAARSEQPHTRASAIWALVYSQTPESLEALHGAATDSNESVCSLALSALRIRNGGEYPRRVAAAVSHHLRAVEGIGKAYAIVWKEVDRDPVAANLESRDRKRVAWLLLASPLGALLSGHAIEALASYRNLPSVRATLETLLESDPRADVREQAFRSLALSKSHSPEPYFRRALEDEAAAVRVSALQHLVSLDEDVLAPLEALVDEMAKDDPDEEVRRYASRAIGARALQRQLSGRGNDGDPSEVDFA